MDKDVILTPEQIAAEERRWLFDAPIAELAEVKGVTVDEAVKLRTDAILQEAAVPIEVTVRPIEPQGKLIGFASVNYGGVVIDDFKVVDEGVDNIILTSKYGKTKCATAKVVAGILTAILTTALIVAFNLFLARAFYGTEGLNCSILFAPSEYVEAFIPFNITCGTLLKYQILLAFTCTISVTGITLLMSAISKNQIVALVAAMAIFLFPVLLPIPETNPLFRLVGLLPVYHVLAVSLLSVEQMSNGMLYAIWAIPTALIFLGIGAGFSRHIFAKHQVS